MTKLEKFIEELKLVPLVGEGGYWVRAYESKMELGANDLNICTTKHPLYNSIYFIMTEKTFSHMHVLKNDELWFYHYGPSVEMLFVFPDSHSEIHVLGPNVDKGERPQILCPKGVYQGAHLLNSGEFTLLSTLNIPGYLDEDFTSSNYEELKPLLSEESHKRLLKKLTGEIEF